MQCDDLEPVVCGFTEGNPDITPSQVHIVMWERLTDGQTQSGSGCSAVQTVDLKKTSGQLKHGSQVNNSCCSLNAEDVQLVIGAVKPIFAQGQNLAKRHTFMNGTSQKTSRYEPFKLGAAKGPINLNEVLNNTSNTSGNSSVCSMSGHSGSAQVVPNIGESKLSPPTQERFLKSLKARLNSTDSVTSSPGSEKSLRLPTFQTDTSVVGPLQKPIPCKTQSTRLFECPGMMVTDVGSGAMENIKPALPGGDDRCKRNVEGTDSLSRSKFSGPVFNIEPSSVFCKPPKPTSLKNTSAENNMSVLESSVSMQKNITEDVESSIYEAGGSQDDANPEISFPSLTGTGMSLDTEILIATPIYGAKIPAQNLMPSVKLENTKKAELKTLRAKNLPIFHRKTQPNYVKNAFSALQTLISKKEAPVSQGMSQVKQYLLGKTTNNSSAKFQGINLKTAQALPQLSSAASFPVLPTQMSSAGSGNGYTQSEDLRLKHKPPSSASSFEGFSFKRKGDSVDSASKNNKKIKVSVDKHKVNVETTSLKENRQVIGSRKTVLPGANLKNNKRVDQWAQKTSETFSQFSPVKQSNYAKHSNKLLATPVKNSQQSEADILQDLYDALDIPLDTLPDTMDTISSSVGDWLGYLDPCEILQADGCPGDSPPLCVSVPGGSRRQKHDW